MRISPIAALIALASACDGSTAATPDAGSTPEDASPNDATSTDATADAGVMETGVATEDAGLEEDAEVTMDAGNPITQSLLFIGTGEWGQTNGQVLGYRFDHQSAELTRTSSAAAGEIASFLAFDPERSMLHVADEGGGRVLSFRISDEDGRLELVDQRTASGHPVYVTTSARHLLAAYYNEGSTEVFALQENGAVGDATDLVSSGAQSHSVRLTPDDRFALVPAKAADWIAQYQLDDATGTLTESTPPRVSTAPGAGPRHLAFHPDGAHAYVSNELDNTVDAYALDPNSGTLAHLQKISALPSGFTGESTGADLHVHPNGRFLYASERVVGGPGLIAIFAIDANGTLAAPTHEETRGETPRNFALTPTGSHLLAANQGSASLAIFSIDEDTGALQFIRTEALGASPFFVGVYPSR